MVAYELETGVYPNTSMNKFTVLYDALFNKPEPRLDPEKFSPAAQDFIALQLLRDIEHRQTTEALLRHEFLQTASPREEFAAWLATIGAPS
jgi:muramidase (phage lysozyme)